MAGQDAAAALDPKPRRLRALAWGVGIGLALALSAEAGRVLVGRGGRSECAGDDDGEHAHDHRAHVRRPRSERNGDSGFGRALKRRTASIV